MYQTAIQIVQKLRSHEYEAYFAGGVVRDLILGKEYGDIDIVTSATPDEIEQLFTQTYPIGKQFGVILVSEQGFQFEVATFRSDSGYSDGRRPDYVLFSSAEEDAKRRDFTINGMFFDPLTEEFIDYVDGKKDLDAKVIRFIGNPIERIREDHLRMLRAVRFAHQIGGQFEPDTYQAIKQEASLIKKVSAERISQELSKILLFPTRAEALEDLQDLGLLKYILPELELLKGIAQPKTYHREGSVWHHAMRSVKSLRGKEAQDISLLWAVLLHDVGKPQTFHVEERIRYDGHAEVSARIAQSILERLRFPKAEMEKIVWAIEHHMSLEHLVSPQTPELTKRKWITHPWFPFLLSLHKADVSGTIPEDFGLYVALVSLSQEIRAHIPKILPKLISGEEISTLLHIPPGPMIGEILQDIHDWQLLGEVTTKAEIIQRIQRRKFDKNNIDQT